MRLSRVRLELHNFDRPMGLATSHRTFANRPQIPHPVGTFLSVSRDQETAIATLEQVQRGRAKFSRFAPTHGE
jgi:hypothetical protein